MRCEVDFWNEMPPDSQVRIIEIGANFFYQDAQGNPDGNWSVTRQANIDCGQSDSLESNDPNKCVRYVYAGVTAFHPETGNKTSTATTWGHAQSCLAIVQFILGPQGATVNGDLAAALSERPQPALMPKPHHPPSSVQNTKKP